MKPLKGRYLPTLAHALAIILSLWLSACVPVFIDLDDGSGKQTSKDVTTSEHDEVLPEDEEGSQDNTSLIENSTDPKLSSFTVNTTIDKKNIGFLDLMITDAPIDKIQNVFISIKSVSITPANKSPLLFEFDTSLLVDLLDLRGSKSQAIFEQLQLPEDHYTHIELTLDTSEELFNYVIKNGAQFPLDTTNTKSQIKIPTNFNIEKDKAVSLTLDVDLRQSIRVAKKGRHASKFILKPVVRLIDNSKSGHITGLVDETLLSVNGCSNADVYLYAGKQAELVDMYELGNKYIGPLTSTKVEFIDGKYQYQLGFVEYGDYTIAATCEADKDTIEQVENISFIHVEPLSHHSLVTLHDHTL